MAANIAERTKRYSFEANNVLCLSSSRKDDSIVHTICACISRSISLKTPFGDSAAPISIASFVYRIHFTKRREKKNKINCNISTFLFVCVCVCGLFRYCCYARLHLIPLIFFHCWLLLLLLAEAVVVFWNLSF